METKTIIFSIAISLMISIVSSNLISQSFDRKMWNISINEHIEKYCKSKGYSSSWVLTFATTTPVDSQLYCYPMKDDQIKGEENLGEIYSLSSTKNDAEIFP